MSKKRKDDDPTNFVERNEIRKLTKVAKSWEFTCSFCFKKFPSAQAMGGHQNTHRNERLEEKRQFVRDPIGYRKRAYLKFIKTSKTESSGASNPTLNMHAASEMIKHELANINVAPRTLKINDLGSNDANENVSTVFMNFIPPKELSLAEKVGVAHAADAKGKACVEFDTGYGTNSKNLDLTLKL